MKNLTQLAKYCTVALFGLGLHLGLITMLVEVAGFHYTVAFVSVLPLTYATKFLLDKHWTFKQAR